MNMKDYNDMTNSNWWENVEKIVHNNTVPKTHKNYENEILFRAAKQCGLIEEYISNTKKMPKKSLINEVLEIFGNESEKIWVENSLGSC